MSTVSHWKRRVVITGMGSVSPKGVGNAAFADAALAGRSGIRCVSRFDPSEIPVQIAGEVRDFDELSWIDKRDRKHRDGLCHQDRGRGRTRKDAGIDTTALSVAERQRFGMLFGSGGGAQEFTEEQYRSFFHQQFKQMSLFCIPAGVLGTLSSDVCIRFDLRGPSHVVMNWTTSSNDAMGYGARQIQGGRADWVLTGGADAPISLGIMKGFVLMKILTDQERTP